MSGYADYDAIMQSIGLSTTLSFVMSLLISVVIIVGYWKLFTKAGEKGWKAIIPCYNTYILYKISWKKSMFWVTLALGIVASAALCAAPLSMLMASSASSLDDALLPMLGLMFVGFLVLIPACIISIMQLYYLSKAYGHGGGFFVGLLFLTPIFVLVLAFGDSRYVGPKGIPAGGYYQQMPYGAPQQPAQGYPQGYPQQQMPVQGMPQPQATPYGQQPYYGAPQQGYAPQQYPPQYQQPMSQQVPQQQNWQQSPYQQ